MPSARVISPIAARLAATAPGTPKQPERNLSRAAIAFVVFINLNWLFFFFANLSHLDRFQMCQHNWAWWATKSIQERKEPVDVLFMGSSLVQRLINEGEATYLNKTIDALTHRNSSQMESLLSPRLHQPVHTFSYAIGGLHASDASMVTSVLLKGEHQPSAIVYGIAPRDFMNSFLAGPSSTEAFEILNRIEEQKDIVMLVHPSNGDKLNYFTARTLSKLLPLYDWHLELAQTCRRKMRKYVGSIADRLVPKPQNPISEIGQIALHMLPEEKEGVLPIPPFDPKFAKTVDNRQAYLFAYRPFRLKVYQTQMHFLERMMQTCSQRGIQLILVNMPLRSDNFAVMEPGFYNTYSRDLQQLTEAHGVPLIDMQKANISQTEDFSDQVHLNGLGAVKFMNALAPRLVPYLQNVAVSSTRTSNTAAKDTAQ